MLLFETRPTTLHKKYSYVYISDDFHLRVEGVTLRSIALVTGCHTKVYIDPCLSFTRIQGKDEVFWEGLTYTGGVLGGLTKYEVSSILRDLPILLLNTIMFKVARL